MATTITHAMPNAAMRVRSHGKPERAEEFRGDRQEGEDGRNTGARKILHGAFEAVAAEPTERFLSAVRENHDCKSDPQKQSRYAAISL